MPYIKFDSTSEKNADSINGFLEYMSKEDIPKGINKEFWFNNTNKLIPDYQVTNTIDNDQYGVARGDFRYYTGSLNFSESELKFVNNNKEKLKEYTRLVFEEYAKNFNRGLTSSDIRWFAKLESDRYYKGTDIEVKNGEHKSGDKKPGINTHIHFIVGRKTYCNKKKVSPLTTHINTKSGAVKGGFSRDSLKMQVELKFDELFAYNRPIEESYRYLNAISKTYREQRNSAIDNITIKNHSVLIYDNLSPNEKHKKLETLINYLQYGGSQNKRCKIDSNRVLKTAQENQYNGNVYKSLLNLNFKIKDGFNIENKDITPYIINYAKFINSPYNDLPKDLKEDRLYRFSLLVNKRLPENNKIDINKIMKYSKVNNFPENTYKALLSLNRMTLNHQSINCNSTLFVLNYNDNKDIHNELVISNNYTHSKTTIDITNLIGNVTGPVYTTSYPEDEKKKKIKKKRRIKRTP
ncbi:DUF5712 family protein [Plebeiibacterium sediminum]|uniref:DUF5712 family protein n=1 Tax=Plebeiibacterium sediminum TaxID=2992112 RepID=A0AAE3M8M4_9BACT|nr:DUF5712 family protein [Plebeiobacterium sediminum]MCW3788904.1 DUF5712 family protein [Plebeiobacterium sediminum]